MTSHIGNIFMVNRSIITFPKLWWCFWWNRFILGRRDSHQVWQHHGTTLLEQDPPSSTTKDSMFASFRIRIPSWSPIHFLSWRLVNGWWIWIRVISPYIQYKSQVFCALHKMMFTLHLWDHLFCAIFLAICMKSDHITIAKDKLWQRNQKSILSPPTWSERLRWVYFSCPWKYFLQER